MGKTLCFLFVFFFFLAEQGTGERSGKEKKRKKRKTGTTREKRKLFFCFPRLPPFFVSILNIALSRSFRQDTRGEEKKAPCVFFK